MAKIDLTTIKDMNQYPCYFFDANIWVLLLKQELYKNHIWNTTDTKDEFSESATFLESILEANIKGNNAPKIAICALLISEITNRYMRDMAMYLHCKSQSITYDPSKFKKIIVVHTTIHKD